jgi:hypothetical protein
MIELAKSNSSIVLWLLSIVKGFASILDGIIVIASFGILYGSFTYAITMIKFRIKDRMKNPKEVK